MAHPITLNPGAPSEMTAEPGAISIPDLWHLAMWLKGISEHIEVIKEHADTSEREHIKALDKAIQYLARLQNGEGQSEQVLETWHLAHALRRYLINHQEPYTSPAPGVIDVPGTGIQVGDRFVHLLPASFELYCSCGHERYNVQLGDFETAPDGSYIWDCPSCDTRIEFDGNDIHVAG